MNFLAASAVALRLGIDPQKIADAALDLKPARHRGEIVTLGDDVTLIDDSYNSNPFAVEAAVTALSLAGGRRRVAFLGDMLELGPTGRDLHLETGRKIAARVDMLIGVGPLSHALLEGAQEAGVAPANLHHFADSSQAAGQAAALINPRDAVLVKGSRGVHMEAIVEALRRRFGLQEEPR